MRDLNKIILKGLHSEAGNYKKRQNYIVGTEFVPSIPTITPLEMRELVKWYNQEKKERHILELACLFHQK